MDREGRNAPDIGFGAYVKPETVRQVPDTEPELYAVPFVSATRSHDSVPERKISETLRNKIGPPLTAVRDRFTPAPGAARGRIAVDPRLALVGVFSIGAFVLGVMLTLYFTADTNASVAQAPADQAPLVAEITEVAVVTPEPAPPALAATPPQEETPAVPDTLAAVVAASLAQEVTRDAPADLISPMGAMSQPDADALSMTEILLGLKSERGVVDADKTIDKEMLNREKLERLRQNVLAGTYTVKVIERNGKQRLCLRLPEDNISQDEAADLIRAAADRGEIELPEALSTSDGTFDADTLIFNLVQTSLAADGTAEGMRAAQEMRAKAAAASKAETQQVEGERTYVVKAGDSLAYISLQFYGQPSAYLKIFEANRDILNTPDHIQTGQRLIIPS